MIGADGGIGREHVHEIARQDGEGLDPLHRFELGHREPEVLSGTGHANL
jgi:hypothetical protein